MWAILKNNKITRPMAIFFTLLEYIMLYLLILMIAVNYEENKQKIF